MSENQAAKAYGLLRAALHTAADDGLIARNPCRMPAADGSGLPSGRR